MSATADHIDLGALRRAIESRDATALTAMYARDADMVMVDYQHPPGAPMRLEGIDAIRAMYDDVCGREMTHEVTHAVAGPSGVAYTEMCRYPDGTRVMFASVCDVRDGRIVHQEGVQAWDEAG